MNNMKVTLESVSDTEILYHLTNTLGELGLIKAKHLMDYYNLNNMNKYDIFMSMLRFATEDEVVLGNGGSVISNIFGRKLLYPNLLYEGILSKEPIIHQMLKLLSSIYACYSEFNVDTYSLINQDLFRNDEHIRKIIIDLLDNKIKIKNNSLNTYFKIVCTIVFDLELHPDFIPDLEYYFRIGSLDFDNVVTILIDIFNDNHNHNKAKESLKERITTSFTYFIREESLYKMKLLKPRFKHISDNRLKKMLSIIDDLNQYIIDNSCGSFTDEDKINMKKFLINFNKYAIERLL